MIYQALHLVLEDVAGQQDKVRPFIPRSLYSIWEEKTNKIILGGSKHSKIIR